MGFSKTLGNISEKPEANLIGKIIHPYYFTPTRLSGLGLTKDDLCWKCKKRMKHMHTCTMGMFHSSSLCGNVPDYVGKWLEHELPRSLRVCLLGDRTVVPQLNKSAFRIIKNVIIIPTLNMWKIQMMDSVGQGSPISSHRGPNYVVFFSFLFFFFFFWPVNISFYLNVCIAAIIIIIIFFMFSCTSGSRL